MTPLRPGHHRREHHLAPWQEEHTGGRQALWHGSPQAQEAIHHLQGPQGMMRFHRRMFSVSYSSYSSSAPVVAESPVASRYKRTSKMDVQSAWAPSLQGTACWWWWYPLYALWVAAFLYDYTICRCNSFDVCHLYKRAPALSGFSGLYSNLFRAPKDQSSLVSVPVTAFCALLVVRKSEWLYKPGPPEFSGGVG